jgi:hypothetical protein
VLESTAGPVFWYEISPVQSVSTNMGNAGGICAGSIGMFPLSEILFCCSGAFLWSKTRGAVRIRCQTSDKVLAFSTVVPSGGSRFSGR